MKRKLLSIINLSTNRNVLPSIKKYIRGQKYFETNFDIYLCQPDIKLIEQIYDYFGQLGTDIKLISRTYRYDNYIRAVSLTNKTLVIIDSFLASATLEALVSSIKALNGEYDIIDLDI